MHVQFRMRNQKKETTLRYAATDMESCAMVATVEQLLDQVDQIIYIIEGVTTNVSRNAFTLKYLLSKWANKHSLHSLAQFLNFVLNVKALAGTFNQEKALVVAFSVIVKNSVKVRLRLCRLLPAPALAIMSNLPRPVRTLSWFPLSTQPACNLSCLYANVGFIFPQS